MPDNITSIDCINKMGTTHSMECHHQLLKIREWDIIHKIIFQQLTFQGNQTQLLTRNLDQIMFILNVLQSKFLNLALEYLFFNLEIHLFATNINTQFGKYAVFRPYPRAIYINAFNIDWSNLKFYAFPPISVIPRVLSKMKKIVRRVL